MTRATRTPPAVALAAAAALVWGRSRGATPARGGVATEAAVRAQTAGLLARYDLDVASFMVTDGHLGYYLRPRAGWPIDGYVRQLPDAAETARALLARYPDLVDVDVCVDGPWLPHGDKAFVPAAQVRLARADAARWPARFDDPADVLAAGLDERSLSYFLDKRVLAESAAYGAATRELSKRRRS